MNQYSSIYQVRKKIMNLISFTTDETLKVKLQEIDNDLKEFSINGIDFKEIVDNLDDSIFITDKNGLVLYVNPAYYKNTGIHSSEVINKDVSDLIGDDKLFTGSAILDVISEKKSVFRLSTTYKTSPPRMGYVNGNPIFDDKGELSQVVACSRPLISLQALQDDFSTFLKEINYINKKYLTKETTISNSKRMIGHSKSLASVFSLINQIADTDATVLITGESGVGKEVIANEIFLTSSRNKEPFVKINCASIPGQLLESELFGYEKGAFSGANSKGKPGLFEIANNGTLMLDEIGDMPLNLQAKLLRAIQSQEITRIGGVEPIKLNIRFLALTNCNLKEKINEGTFRQDLYYRLNVIPLHIPPLRDRLDDLEEFCQHFINIFCDKYNRTFKLTESQMIYLKSYDWPGNIRELENIIEYLVICSSGIGCVDDNTLHGLLNISQLNSPVVVQNTDFNTAVSSFEKQLIETVLHSSNNLREAGERLNINASTISRKIKQYNIEYPIKK